MIVYRVRHIETGAFLKGGHSKHSWASPGNAKNAWYAHEGGWNKPKWDDQTEWEIVKFKLVEVFE